jgi:hypothetical protein
MQVPKSNRQGIKIIIKNNKTSCDKDKDRKELS